MDYLPRTNSKRDATQPRGNVFFSRAQVSVLHDTWQTARARSQSLRAARAVWAVLHSQQGQIVLGKRRTLRNALCGVAQSGLRPSGQGRVGTVEDPQALAAIDDKTGCPQMGEMAGDERLPGIQRVRQLADAKLCMARQQYHAAQTRFVGQRSKEFNWLHNPIIPNPSFVRVPKGRNADMG